MGRRTKLYRHFSRSWQKVIIKQLDFGHITRDREDDRGTVTVADEWRMKTIGRSLIPNCGPAAALVDEKYFEKYLTIWWSRIFWRSTIMRMNHGDRINKVGISRRCFSVVGGWLCIAANEERGPNQLDNKKRTEKENSLLLLFIETDDAPMGGRRRRTRR